MVVLCDRCKGAKVPPLTCGVLKGGPCAPCKESASIRRKIAHLEAKITKLKAKHDTLATTINAIHDPFIHKLPPEIGSHIFRLSLPTFNPENLLLYSRGLVAAPLRLGAVCRKWRQLAWATPNLWESLDIVIRRWTSLSLAESLPDLLREFLDRSGVLPLTIFFYHFGFRSDADYTPSEDEFSDDSPSDDPAVDMLKVAAGLVIEILKSHSGRWRNVYLDMSAEIFPQFSGSIRPRQLADLGLRVNSWPGEPRSMPELTYMLKWELNPTRLTLTYFPFTSLNVGWENITHATLNGMSTEAGIDFLQRAPGLEYYHVSIDDNPIMHRHVAGINFKTPVLHPQLHSFHLSTPYVQTTRTFLDAIQLPALKEWTQDAKHSRIPVATVLSFLERSGCRLRVLDLEDVRPPFEDFNTILQALPSLERLQIHFSFSFDCSHTVVMDDILTRIFSPLPSGRNFLVGDATPELFLPCLQFLECRVMLSDFPPLSWDRLPQLYRQGLRRSLVLKSHAYEMLEETALQLLQLVDEGMDLQIIDARKGDDFLENFRNRTNKQGV